MTDIVGKLWGFCHTLRHDGIDYGDYIEQLTYLLFLKMIEEKGAERGLGVRLAILQFLFGVIHKKVAPLQMGNADCGLRNAEFKILKTAWSIAQRALR